MRDVRCVGRVSRTACEGAGDSKQLGDRLGVVKRGLPLVTLSGLGCSLTLPWSKASRHIPVMEYVVFRATASMYSLVLHAPPYVVTAMPYQHARLVISDW